MVTGVTPGDSWQTVFEIFSPLRVTAAMRAMPSLTLVGGDSFDLQKDEYGRSWDFLKEEDRRRCRERVLKEKPYFVIGSPPCTLFSTLQNLSRAKRENTPEFRARLAEARVLLEFMTEIYEIQLAGGRHFLHEHPVGAVSWSEPGIKRLRGDSRV